MLELAISFAWKANGWAKAPTGGRDSPYPPFWGVGPVVYAAGLSIRYFTGSNPVHPAISLHSMIYGTEQAAAGMDAKVRHQNSRNPRKRAGGTSSSPLADAAAVDGDCAAVGSDKAAISVQQVR